MQVGSASAGDIQTVTALVGQPSKLSLFLELHQEGPSHYVALYSDAQPRRCKLAFRVCVNTDQAAGLVYAAPPRQISLKPFTLCDMFCSHFKSIGNSVQCSNLLYFQDFILTLQIPTLESIFSVTVFEFSGQRMNTHLGFWVCLAT